MDVGFELGDEVQNGRGVARKGVGVPVDAIRQHGGAECVIRLTVAAWEPSPRPLSNSS